MPMPTGLGIIDLMLGIPIDEQTRSYDFMRPLLRDKESLESFAFPVEYMFMDASSCTCTSTSGASRWPRSTSSSSTRSAGSSRSSAS